MPDIVVRDKALNSESGYAVTTEGTPAANEIR